MSAAVVPDLSAAAVPVPALGPVHLIGVGGAGMSAIARLMLARGVPVSGSDARGGPVLDALAALGARVFVGHAAHQVPASGSVIVSSAVRADNPELLAARAAGLRIMHRSEALASLMLDRRAVAIAGTHGKTTTTGMVTVLLTETGLAPSFAIGGELTEGGLGAAEGASDIFVAEADESDGSFMLYRPDVAVITNIEPDHLDHYGSAEAVEAAFARFCERIVDGGLLVACGDDARVAAMLGQIGPGLAARGVAVQLYGTGPGNDVTLSDLDDTPDGVRYRLCVQQEPVGEVALRMPGAHNALNSAAAWAVAVRFGVPPATAAQALSVFGGTRRRFETRGSAGGVRVIDDYAHHPTEVAAVLSAARTAAGAGRVIAIFQPHLFSRTRIFASDFGAALGAADEVIVLDVYAAREDPEPGVTGALVADAVPLPSGHVTFAPGLAAVPGVVAQLARPGDLVLTLGAGDVTSLGPAILTALSTR
jgi:UDP-N-acetylmuramate--alanine ligase